MRVGATQSKVSQPNSAPINKSRGSCPMPSRCRGLFSGRIGHTVFNISSMPSAVNTPPMPNPSTGCAAQNLADSARKSRKVPPCTTAYKYCSAPVFSASNFWCSATQRVNQACVRAIAFCMSAYFSDFASWSNAIWISAPIFHCALIELSGVISNLSPLICDLNRAPCSEIFTSGNEKI